MHASQPVLAFVAVPLAAWEPTTAVLQRHVGDEEALQCRHGFAGSHTMQSSTAATNIIAG